MDESHYERLRTAEQSWWYRGRECAVKSALARFELRPGAVLDYGAGFGAMHSLLSRYGPVTAFEKHATCLEACRKRGYAKTLADPEELFRAPERFVLVGAFDVIEHVERDSELVERIRRVLTADGLFVATVPAHQFLWSEFDVVNHHYRRYSRRQLRTLFESAGFDVRFCTFWNMALFPIAALLRLLGHAGAEGLAPHPFVNSALSLWLRAEGSLVRFTSLPAGLSLLIVASVQAQDTRHLAFAVRSAD